MITQHRTICADSRNLSQLSNSSIQLVITSPPYPMIEMWDNAFIAMDPQIESLLKTLPLSAFDAMHQLLDEVWGECWRVLIPGGFLCVNIGDATRTLGGEFRLYHNHSRVISGCVSFGFSVLPDIIWRKPTNAPTKFMGSGMLPAGAYVTYEHEYILVFRKGGKRCLQDEERKLRRESAYFWEERNIWFSDLWNDLKGTSQSINNGARSRSAAFPFELPYRLTNMYSICGDNILDPFVGTGTTMLAAVASARNSIGVEILPDLKEAIFPEIMANFATAQKRTQQRMEEHLKFIDERSKNGYRFKYLNKPHAFPVFTAQETDLLLWEISDLNLSGQDLMISEYTKAEIKSQSFKKIHSPHRKKPDCPLFPTLF